MNITTQQDTQAAANKAAEEGELPTSDFQWRKKPVVIEAIQWPGCRFPETPPQWFIDAMHKKPGNPGFLMRMDDNIFIETLEGRMRAEPGDWIIRGIAGEIYPCKPEIFEGSYERASRQVANKAEVELSSLSRFGYFATENGTAMVPNDGGKWVQFDDVKALLATPPATTGASTARDGNPIYQVNAAGASGSWRNVNKAQYDLAADTCRRIVTEQVSASTVLTDERIIAEAREWGLLDTGYGGHIDQSEIIGFVREVAAQAGQVVVPGWISVDDRLPELQKEVLICCGYLVLGYRTDDKHDPENHNGWVIDFDNGMASPITHWMPLPPSPAKESK